MSTNSIWKCVFIATSAIAFSVVLLLTLQSGSPAGAETTTPSTADPAGESFVYRFDPISETYVFTFTIPTSGADPTDVIVVPGAGCQEVWFTESGADRIGRLTYTDTLDYAYQYYTLTTDSQPLNLVSGGGFIWFTEAGRDQIGRLDPSTGQIDEFPATSGSYPADLDYDTTDGSIWFTEMGADQIAHLEVTSPTDYTLTEHYITSLSGGRPYGIVVNWNALAAGIYFAETANDRLTIFTPPDSWVQITDPVDPSIPDEPYALALDSTNRVWTTERAGNRLTGFAYGTYSAVKPYTVTPTSSLPTGLVADSNDYIWFTQWQAGQIGQLKPGGASQRTYYPLPLPGLAPTGIATEDTGGTTEAIWVLASRPHRLYLPLVLESYCGVDPIPSHGVQFYSELDSHNGFYDLADAGMQWARYHVNWAAIEPVNTTPNNYNWSSFDPSVNSASQRGVHLVLTIAGQPSWAATYPQGPVTDTADIVEFVGALVERYDGDGVDDAPGSPTARYFELYNEPDNFLIGPAKGGGWGYWGHDGAGYADLLQTLYPVVKAASPQAKLVFGGIALEPTGAFNMQFLDDVLPACQGQACFDVMNFHYYPCFRGKWDSYGTDIIGKANYVKQKLVAYGFAGKPTIVTETGYPSGVVWGSDERQSRYVVQVNARAKAAGLPVTIWYKDSDQGAWDLPGLLDDNYQPKPSYWAFENMAKMLAKASYQHTLTPAETGSNKIEGYSFQLSCNQRLDVAWTEGDSWSSTADDPSVPMTVYAETLRVSDKDGNQTLYKDNHDGKNDGRITVIIGGDPLFLEYNP